jgi:hypothetical protein
MDGFFDKVDSFLDKVTKSRAGQSYAVSFIMFVTLLPIFASSLGFIVARSKTTHYLVKEENAQYIVVRRYSDQVILVELSDRHVVIPNYKVEYIASGRDLVFRSEMIKNLNYSKVK